MQQNKIQLGTLLVKHNLLTGEQLEQALAIQKTQGSRLGQVLVELGHLTETQVLSFLAEQLNLSFINLKNYQLNQELAQKLPELYARRFRGILLEDTEEYLLIGMADPQDLLAYDELSKLLKRPLKIAVVAETDMLNSFNAIYRRTREIASFAEELSEELGETDFDLAQLGKNATSSDAPVVKLLQSILEDAVQIRASDIHIEPEENLLRIRQRVDGVLQENIMKEVRIASALTQRFKLMASLNIAEKRLPQDGRFSIKVKDRTLDVRLSTLPVQFGESLVMRLLDNSAVAPQLERLGLPTKELEILQELVQRHHGMLLVTGPTGSGKTTTLYSILTKLNKVNKKIITVEDPIEYRLPRVNQVQVNANIGLDFAKVLRTALRQDPDVIMIGEIRDKETSSIALRAAMTGHLVLATMHTNDALSSAMRMMDLGCEGYLIANAISAIIAQRLMRAVCTNCKEEYKPLDAERRWIENLSPEVEQYTLYQGKGCSHCNSTGYKGRIGIYEILSFDAPMQEALYRNDTVAFTRVAKEQKYITLSKAALNRVFEGTSTMAEVGRVAL